MSEERDAARAALREVVDPELGFDIVALGMVRDLRLSPAAVELDLVMTSPSCPLGHLIVEDAADALRDIAGERAIRVRLVEEPPWTAAEMEPELRARLGWAP